MSEEQPVQEEQQVEQPPCASSHDSSEIRKGADNNSEPPQVDVLSSTGGDVPTSDTVEPGEKDTPDETLPPVIHEDATTAVGDAPDAESSNVAPTSGPETQAEVDASVPVEEKPLAESEEPPSCPPLSTETLDKPVNVDSTPDQATAPDVLHETQPEPSPSTEDPPAPTQSNPAAALGDEEVVGIKQEEVKDTPASDPASQEYEKEAAAPPEPSSVPPETADESTEGLEPPYQPDRSISPRSSDSGPQPSEDSYVKVPPVTSDDPTSESANLEEEPLIVTRDGAPPAEPTSADLPSEDTPGDAEKEAVAVEPQGGDEKAEEPVVEPVVEPAVEPQECDEKKVVIEPAVVVSEKDVPEKESTDEPPKDSVEPGTIESTPDSTTSPDVPAEAECKDEKDDSSPKPVPQPEPNPLEGLEHLDYLSLPVARPPLGHLDYLCLPVARRPKTPAPSASGTPRWKKFKLPDVPTQEPKPQELEQPILPPLSKCFPESQIFQNGIAGNGSLSVLLVSPEVI